MKPTKRQKQSIRPSATSTYLFNGIACVLLCLSGVLAAPIMLAAQTPSSTAADMSSQPGRLISIGSHKLYLYCRGQGSPTIVLESGLGGTHLDWAKVQPTLAQTHRVCSYDRAGYGWSERGPIPRTSEVFVDELARLLRLADESPPYILVGHSLGGFTVRGFAHQFPEQVAGMVLVDSSHEQQYEQPDELGQGLVPTQRRQFVISNYYTIPQGLPESLQTLAQRFAVKPDAVYTLYNELGDIKQSAYTARQWQFAADLPLVVLAHDSVARAKTDKAQRFAENWIGLQQELAQRSSRSQFKVIADSGHHIHLDQPSAVIDAINSILALLK